MSRYRDILVQQIKDTGQELIDRAEDMVGPELDAIAEFHIYIDLSPDADAQNIPHITWETTVLNKRAVQQ